MSSPNLLVAAMAGTLIATAAIVATAWAFARLWCRPSRMVAVKDPGSLGLPYEFVRLRGQKGRFLHSWFIPARSRSSVILVHGWSRNAAQLVHLVPFFHAQGISVLLFDARGHGQSDGDGPITILKFAEDIRSAVDYLVTRREVDPSRIGVLGHSIGASAAIIAAVGDGRIRALVSSSAFADPALLTRRVMAKLHLPRFPFFTIARWFIERWLGTGMDDVSPMRKVDKIAVPLLLIHGEGDRFVPPSDLRTLHGLSTTKHLQAWPVPRRDHSSVLYHRDLGPRVADFMAGALSDRPGALTMAETTPTGPAAAGGADGRPRGRRASGSIATAA